jgi:hypothetical protein
MRVLAHRRARCDSRSARVGRRELRVHPGDTGSLGERWVTKRELAEHLRVTPRFIELQQRLGLPVLRVGALNRYRVSEVEAWLRDAYSSTARAGGA